MTIRFFAAILYCWSIGVAYAACDKPIYLTFDTGNMSVAEHVATTLRKHQVQATFFLANEKTYRGDYAMDDFWLPFWRTLATEGHSFGSHTFDHTYFVKNISNGHVQVKSQFGAQAGRLRSLNQPELCQDIRRVDERFMVMTGKHLDPIWRAPGGKTSIELIRMSNQCGWTHVGWSAHGFLGDELPSDRFPNSILLERALKELRPGDIAMAHLGIWSRKDPWAQAVLEPLIVGLKRQGYCFGLIRDIRQSSAVSGIMSLP